jgi:hypothetical protein
VRFLADVVHEYSKCGGMPAGVAERLAEKIAEFDGGYTLAARYAGLWLKANGCNAGDVEGAVEASRRGPKLFFAFYIRDVLLWRSSEEERVRLVYRAAAPLLLHAVFGPVPEGITYITQAKSEGAFYQPEEIEKLTQPQWDLLKAGLQPIAHWLAQRHEDLVEEALRDLAGLNGEEVRELCKEALGDLIEALDWARGEVLKEGAETFAKLSVPEDGRDTENSLLAFVVRMLAAVFKRGESRSCWRRAALIAGHALAGHLVLPRSEWLLKDVAEALGDALEPCAVDAYLTIDGEIPPLSIYVARLMLIRELNILSPLADTETINAARKTAEELLARWRGRGVRLAEAFYALGLAALAAEGEVDGGMADLLLYATPFAVQRVTHPGTVLPVLAALRPLGEKALHRYVSLLAAASELRTLYPETVWYIYDALQQLGGRLIDTERIWPLVDAVRAYSNLLRRYPEHIWDRWEEAVADMCELYDEVRKRDSTTAPESGLSAQRLLDAVTRAYVLAVALGSDVLAQYVQRHCGLSDIIKEAKAVKGVLDDAAADPEELRKIKNEDFAEWVTTLSSTGDARFAVENMRAWFTHVLARYKLNHALDEKGELNEKKLKEAAKEFKKAAKIERRLKQWENYLTARSFALRARVLAAKSREELFERAKGFYKLWRKEKKRLKPTAIHLAGAVLTFGDYLVYLAASGNKKMAEELLKKWRQLLDYRPEVSVATRLMLRLLGVGKGARQEEVVEAFKPQLSPEFRPALLMLAGHLQKDEAHKECDELFNAQPPEAERCDIIVAAAAGNRIAAERLRSVIEKVVSEARLLLDKADGRTPVEVLTPITPAAQLALMLLAAVEGRADAVRLHGLWGSAKFEEPLPRRLFRAVYESCSDLDSEGCRMALLKLYYLHF